MRSRRTASIARSCWTTSRGTWPAATHGSSCIKTRSGPPRWPTSVPRSSDASPYLAEYVPAFRAHLLAFPRPGLADSEDFLYWSKERFGYKPVVSITHVTIQRLRREGGHGAAVIASKQIYASHYFAASLGLSAFVETGAPAGAYLVYLNRSRSDLLQGMFSGVIRFFLRRRVLDGLDKYQRLTKEKLERDYRATRQVGERRTAGPPGGFRQPGQCSI